MLLMLPVLFLIGLGAAVSSSSGAGPVVIATLGVLAVLYMLVLSTVFSALGTIFSSAVYVYATTGKAPGSIDPQLLQSAFRPKK
jgi:hypothetical protein